MIPKSIKRKIEQKLDDQVESVNLQSGGDINHAAILQFKTSGPVFLKWNSHAPELMFEAEARGLKLLTKANSALVIPKVLLTEKTFLVMSFVKEGSANSESSLQFGIQLARQHRFSSQSFGLDHDNFIGKLPQSNTQHLNWADFFVSERIAPQVKMGVDSGKLPQTMGAKIDQFAKNIFDLFPEESPALLHGDLWSGNYMFTEYGTVSIYDPAVYYGHREMDIAMARLFGGFSSHFYEGYNSEYPLSDGHEKRVALCNLYPVLVHANLFGGSYCQKAEAIFSSYC